MGKQIYFLQHSVIIISSSQGSNTNPNFQLVNEPSRISPHEVLQSDLFNTVFHLLVKNINKGKARGGGRLKRERELISFLPLTGGGGGLI